MRGGGNSEKVRCACAHDLNVTNNIADLKMVEMSKICANCGVIANKYRIL